MKIKKSKDGSTSVQILPNQKIKYDPNISSYVIETNILDGQVHLSTIPDYILDELYNRAWHDEEDDDDPRMPKPNVED